MLLQKKPLIERRHEPPEQSQWWSKLSLAQKFSASSLGKFGYELIFVRYEQGCSVAVLSCPDGVATINESGDINTSKDLTIRG